MPTHPNKIPIPIKKWVYSIMSTHQILIFSYPLKTKKKKKKIESKFIHQFPKLHTMQSSINHQHCLNLTISNNSTIQKFLKNQHDHTMISIQIIQYPKIPTRANNNKTTMPHHKVLNQTRNQQIYQPKKKEKKRMRSPWNLFWVSVEHGCLGLEGVPLHHGFCKDAQKLKDLKKYLKGW